MYQNTSEKNPYKILINAYVGEEFENATKKVIKITDEISEGVNKKTKEKMKESFVYSTKLEYMFWDSAYKLDKWII
jgi:thiaminase/transcriptional activator TenA